MVFGMLSQAREEMARERLRYLEALVSLFLPFSLPCFLEEFGQCGLCLCVMVWFLGNSSNVGYAINNVGIRAKMTLNDMVCVSLMLRFLGNLDNGGYFINNVEIRAKMTLNVDMVCLCVFDGLIFAGCVWRGCGSCGRVPACGVCCQCWRHSRLEHSF